MAPTAAMIKNDPKTVNAWCMYDWANSVYNLIVTTAIFPIYYTGATESAFGGETVRFFGIEVVNTVIYTYAISFSFLLIVILSPILSGIADYSGRKKLFMQLFTYMGSLACIGLYFFDGKNIEYGLTCAVLASTGYAGALVFYNGFLPEIATNDRMDRISARGFSLGYVGSLILLVASLVLILNAAAFGFDGEGNATRFVFLLVGFWWMGFAQIPFRHLKETHHKNKVGAAILTKGLKELKGVIKQLSAYTAAKKFLTAFFFYSMGVQTVMLLAPLFGEKMVGLESSELIVVVMIVQVLAIAGAYLFALLSEKQGNKFSIAAALVVWIGICFFGYFAEGKNAFYALAAFLGLVMGGIQSMSRSTYSKLIPENTKETASYFSFFDITEKLAITLGTFSYGITEQLTGNMRNSLLGMSVFFATGLLLLLLAKMPKRLNA